MLDLGITTTKLILKRKHIRRIQVRFRLKSRTSLLFSKSLLIALFHSNGLSLFQLYFRGFENPNAIFTDFITTPRILKRFDLYGFVMRSQLPIYNTADLKESGFLRRFIIRDIREDAAVLPGHVVSIISTRLPQIFFSEISFVHTSEVLPIEELVESPKTKIFFMLEKWVCIVANRT